MSFQTQMSINKFNTELSKAPTDFSKSDLADLSSRINQFSDSLKGFDAIDSSESIANLKEKLNSLTSQAKKEDQVLEVKTPKQSSSSSSLKTVVTIGAIALITAAATSLLGPSVVNEMSPIPGPGAMTVFDPSVLNEMCPIPGPGAMTFFDPSVLNEMSPIPGPGAMTLFDPSIVQENSTSLLATLPQPSHSNEMCPIPGPGAMIPFDPSIAQKNSTSPLTTLPQLSHSDEMSPVPGPGAIALFDPSIVQENSTSNLPSPNQGQLNLTRDDQDLSPIGTLVKEVHLIGEPMSNSSTIMTAILAPFALLATCFSRCSQKAPPALLAVGNIKGSWHTNTAKRCDSTKRVFDTLVIKGKTADFVRNAQNQLGKAEAYAKENLMSEGGSDRETTLARTSKSGYELTVQKAFSTGIESVVMQFESLKTANALNPKTVTRIFTPN